MSTYNDAAHLAESIDSVLTQDFKDFEFIIANDGSPDPRCGRILADYAKKDDRIRVITKTNEGLTKALIVGCAEAKGKYVARIDAGDLMMPGRLAKQADILERFPNCSFVSCWTEFRGPEKEFLRITKGHPQTSSPVDVLPSDPNDGLQADISHHVSVMFRTSAYREAGGYRAEFRWGQDWDLWYRLAEHGTYFVVPEVLCRALVDPNGISMRNVTRQRAMAECSANAFIARRTDKSEEQWLNRAREVSHRGTSSPTNEPTHTGFYFIGETLRRNGNPAARRYFRQALRINPFCLKALLRIVQSILLQQP